MTDWTNKAANAIDQAAQNTEQQVARSSGLEGAMANLESSVQGYATEAAKNMKVCPNCNKPTTADKKFCHECGTQLPEQTVAQGAVCPNCGKQNAIGTKFCQDCGTKLPDKTLYDIYKKRHTACPTCDTVVASDSDYCPQCGTKLETS